MDFFLVDSNPSVTEDGRVELAHRCLAHRHKPATIRYGSTYFEDVCKVAALFIAGLDSPRLLRNTMATCYYPDGNVWTADWPCWNTTNPNDYAPCCANQNYCFSNGWCMSGNDMKPYRGGCTDKSWRSDSCNKKCTGSELTRLPMRWFCTRAPSHNVLSTDKAFK